MLRLLYATCDTILNEGSMMAAHLISHARTRVNGENGRASWCPPLHVRVLLPRLRNAAAVMELDCGPTPPIVKPSGLSRCLLPVNLVFACVPSYI